MGCEFSSSSSATRAQEVLNNTKQQNGRGTTPRPSETFSEFRSKGILTDLNLNDPDLQEAATRIQATYRGHRTRNTLKMAQEEEVVDIDLNDPDVKNAAQKIQNSFRGHQKKRAELKEKVETELSKDLKKLNTKEEEPEELPDLSDPELNKAATKIQAQFRGHMVRKPQDEPSK